MTSRKVTKAIDAEIGERVARVLVVDDLPQNRAVLQRLLESDGYRVAAVKDVRSAHAEIEQSIPDIVLSDVQMPGASGIDLCATLKQQERTRLLPVVLITGMADRSSRLAAIRAGADDFIAKPFDVDELRARVRSLLRLKRYTDDLESAESVIMSLALTVEARDPYTFGHCERLASYAVSVGRAVGLPDDHLQALQRGGYLHDIGKIAVPDAILFKAASLTQDEFRCVSSHTIVGERLCGGLRSLALVRRIVRSHHECLDGRGYPDGLKGDKVPLLAQIISVVDRYDAMTTDRPYRCALSSDFALEQLRLEARVGRLSQDLVKIMASEVERRRG